MCKHAAMGNAAGHGKRLCVDPSAKLRVKQRCHAITHAMQRHAAGVKTLITPRSALRCSPAQPVTHVRLIDHPDPTPTPVTDPC